MPDALEFEQPLLELETRIARLRTRIAELASEADSFSAAAKRELSKL